MFVLTKLFVVQHLNRSMIYVPGGRLPINFVLGYTHFGGFPIYFFRVYSPSGGSPINQVDMGINKPSNSLK